MRRHRFRSLLAFAAVALLFVASCGGESESTSSDATADGAAVRPTTTTGDESSTRSGDADADRNPESSAKEPAPVPVEKIEVPPVPNGADDSIQTFGEEADPEESAQIVAVVKAWVAAQMKGDWRRACALLSASIDAQIEALSDQTGSSADCESVFEAQGSGSKRALRPLAKLEVGSVRVDEDSGFVIFKAGGAWYALSVVSEDGHWRVGSPAPVPLN